MKTGFCLVILISLFPIILLSQDIPLPGSPVIGWDALKDSMFYPEILRRAGVEGAAYVYGVIDSTGSIESVTIYANMERFKESVRKAIYSTKWHTPKHQKWTLAFNVHFFISGVSRVNVEVQPAKIIKMQ